MKEGKLEFRGKLKGLLELLSLPPLDPEKLKEVTAREEVELRWTAMCAKATFGVIRVIGGIILLFLFFKYDATVIYLFIVTVVATVFMVLVLSCCTLRFIAKPSNGLPPVDANDAIKHKDKEDTQ